jgi:S-adenosylmethionine:tRNA ribosyltransferase-isomerase
MNPKEINIRDFTYDLPTERIAKYPLAERSKSKLLVYKNNVIEESNYEHVAHFIPENSLLLFNNTKVVEARLLFQKATGGQIELFCLEPGEDYADITTAMLQKGEVKWKCLVGGAKKWKDGEVLKKEIHVANSIFYIEVSLVEKLHHSFLIHFSWNAKDMTFAEVLHVAGIIPLPPYLNRVADESDQTRYQTIYAQHDGSVAAPTAGLHFTNELISDLSNKHIEHAFVTLHVGAGTFKPVKTETLAEHDMHAEYIDVEIDVISKIANGQYKHIIPVGTTSCRTLESMYWMGVKAIIYPEATIEELEIKQWDVYELPQAIAAQQAFGALIHWMKKKQHTRLICKTQLLITPYYTLRKADAIFTNFHQPNSTLLLLISAFVGESWKIIYDYAMQHDFRFLSYGDGCLLWKRE